MDPIALLTVASVVLAFGLISGRAERSVITPPMVFTGVGLLVGSHGLGLTPMRSESLVHTLAELTLILVLFSDASRIDLRQLKKDHSIPIRLLLIGMPLTIALGALAAIVLFPQWSLWEGAVLAAILAPTDAALGQAVVSSPVVPVRVRQALNVESGLNDGIALPLVLLLLSVASVTHGGETGAAYWIRFTALQLTLGPLCGLAVGVIGAKLVERGMRSGWMNHSFASLSLLAMALSAFSLSELMGGNGFIAAFVGGMAMGNTSREVSRALESFGEAEGQLLALLTFLVFGAALLPEAFHESSGAMLLYGVLSLSLVRMLPVAISAVGLKLQPTTIGFLGWFGPRGLATILFGLLVVDEAQLPHEKEILATAVLAVFMSVIAHGLTAYPAAQAYGARCSAMPDAREEQREVFEHPMRKRS